MSRTEYGDISPRTAAYAYTKMLEHAEPVIILGKFGDAKPLPKNKTETVKFRRPVPYAAATTPLIEGVTPNAKKIAFEDVTVSLKQYGDLHSLTDKIQDLHEDPVLNEMVMLAGENGGRTVEALLWGVVRGGTSVFYANGVARTAVNTKITQGMQRKITRFLKNQKAQKFTRILDGSVKIGTKPVEASYVAVAHTDCESDIRDMAKFIPVAEYGSQKPLCEEEIGAVEDVRYILSPDLDQFEDAGGTSGGAVESTTGAQADVYPIIYLGMHAFGTTPLKHAGSGKNGNNAIKPTVINPESVDKSDPLGQRGFVGWKTWWAGVRLNEAWMARAEVAVTAL